VQTGLVQTFIDYDRDGWRDAACVQTVTGWSGSQTHIHIVSGRTSNPIWLTPFPYSPFATRWFVVPDRNADGYDDYVQTTGTTAGLYARPDSFIRAVPLAPAINDIEGRIDVDGDGQFDLIGAGQTLEILDAQYSLAYSLSASALAGPCRFTRVDRRGAIDNAGGPAYRATPAAGSGSAVTTWTGTARGTTPC
jgi:hypothetical protein